MQMLILPLHKEIQLLPKRKFRFRHQKKTATLNLLLPADKLGLQIFKASISSTLCSYNHANITRILGIGVSIGNDI